MEDNELNKRLVDTVKRNALFGTIDKLGCFGFIVIFLIGICVIGTIFKLFGIF